jgi:hypothetical protein
MIVYVVDASHKEALTMGVPVDGGGLAEAEHEIPAEGGIIEIGGKLLCFVATATDPELALKAIIARVDQKEPEDAPELTPYAEHIETGDDSGEQCSVDCRAIARMALGLPEISH